MRHEVSTLIGYYPAPRPLLWERGQPPSGFQKAAAKAPPTQRLYLNLALKAKGWTCYFLDSGLPEVLPRQSLRRTSRRRYDRQYRRRLGVHS